MGSAFELHESLADQVGPDMCRPVVAVFAGSARVRQLDRLLRNLAFGQRTLLGDLLHDVPIAITGGKIHPGVDAAGIPTKCLLDNAHCLDELAPVHRA